MPTGYLTLSPVALMLDAWNAAFGRDPKLERAMDRANKAIEAAYAPIVIPDSPTPSTGTVIAAIRDKPSKFAARLTSDEADAVCSWLEVFWNAQSRHVGHDDLGDDEVRDAVVVATTLVDLAQRDGFTRRG